MEERYYVDGRHRDRDENSTPTWVSLNSNLFLKDDETQNLVFAINKHVPNIPCIRC